MLTILDPDTCVCVSKGTPEPMLVIHSAVWGVAPLPVHMPSQEVKVEGVSTIITQFPSLGRVNDVHTPVPPDDTSPFEVNWLPPSGYRMPFPFGEIRPLRLYPAALVSSVVTISRLAVKAATVATVIPSSPLRRRIPPFTVAETDGFEPSLLARTMTAVAAALTGMVSVFKSISAMVRRGSVEAEDERPDRE